jgi:ABC-type transport system involved in multi-copper enzyme maturation permease subunit
VTGKRAPQMMFVMAWMPFILFMTYVYLRVNAKIVEQFGIPLNQLPAVDVKFFISYLLIQMPFMFIFTVLIGPALIATDIRNNALPMILSKPISQWQYLFGKFSVLFILLSAISWFPVSILFVAQTAAVPKADPWLVNFWSQNVWLWPKCMIFSLIMIVTLDLLVLFFSALTKNPRFAGVALIMFIIGSIIVGRMASEIFNSNNWLALSPPTSLMSIASYIFQDQGKEDVPVHLAFAYICALWTVSLIFLHKRVRAFQMHRA